MVKLNSEILSNLVGNECLVSLKTESVKVSLVVKDLEILFNQSKILIGEKDFETPIIEVDYEYLEIEYLDLSNDDDKEIRINLNDKEYINITSLVD
jgi:hypothetical protein